MKLVFFADLHLAANPPGQRLGDYAADLIAKLEWVSELAQEQQADYVVCGGDFVNHPAVSLRVVNEALDALGEYGNRLVAVFGQHDLSGHSPSSLPGSAASLLLRASPYTAGTNDGRVVKLAGKSAWLINFHPQVNEWVTAWEHEIEKPEFTVVHAPIGFSLDPQDVRLPGRVVFCGDFHGSFAPVQLSTGGLLVHPGSLGRNSIAQYDHQPQVAWADTETMEVEYIPVPCRPAAEIFDLAKHHATKQTSQDHSRYLDMLQAVTVQQGSPVETILKGMGLDEQVEGYVLEKIQEAERSLA